MKKTIFLSIFALTIVSLVTGCADSKKASDEFLPGRHVQGEPWNTLTIFDGLETKRANELYKNVFTTEEGALYQWTESEKDENGHYDISKLSKLKSSTETQNPFGIKVEDYIPFNDIDTVSDDDIDFRYRTIVDGNLVEVEARPSRPFMNNLREFLGYMVFVLANHIKDSRASNGEYGNSLVYWENDIVYLNSAYRLLAKIGHIRLKDADDIEQGLILVQSDIPFTPDIDEILRSSEILSSRERENFRLYNLVDDLQNMINKQKKQAESNCRDKGAKNTDEAKALGVSFDNCVGFERSFVFKNKKPPKQIKPQTAFTEYELRCIGFGFKNDDVDACVKQEKFYDKRIKDQEVILSYKLKQQEKNYQRKLDQLDDDTSVDWWSMRESDEKYRLNRKIYNLEKKLDRQIFLNNRERRKERQRQNKDEYKMLEPIKYNNYNDE